MPEHTLMLIDGNSLIYRAFFALRPLANTRGQSTHAVYGFVNMLFKLLEDEKPDYLVVAMDVGKTTFRNEEYEQYKATRQETPEDLLSQMPIIRRFLEGMRVPVLEKKGFEADDIIGTLSLLGEKDGLSPVIVTGDRDALQLISDDTTVLLTRKGITDMERYGTDTIMEKYHLVPAQLIEVKGLMGDASDNIPGVPGIGEKTALKLIREYGTIDGVLSHLDRLSGKKLQENLQDYAPQALLSKKLATIIRSVPMDIHWEELKRQDPDYDAVIGLFRELEFRTLTARVEKMAGTEVSLFTSTAAEDVSVQNLTDEMLTTMMKAAQPLGITVELDSIYIAGDEGHVYRYTDGSSKTHIKLRALLEDEEIKKCIWQVKTAYKLINARGIALRGINFDPLIAAYLLDPGKNRYRLEDLAAEHIPDQADQFRNIHPENETRLVRNLAQPMLAQLKEFDQIPLLNEMEMPLSVILAKMELDGIRVDEAQLREMGKELDSRIESLATAIFEHAGQEFNINSPRQLGEILFEKLDLPVGRKTKTGYSTDVEVLSNLARKHPIAEVILEYRQLVKLKGTYVEGLLGLIDSQTGRIHTTFNQTVTTTGRISSTDPNLQNIPIRSETGREIRKAFVAGHPEWKILAADYSQIELRVLAHLSEDETLSDSFFKGEDIHTRTASEVFGVPLDEVTPTLRNKAKAVNFGIIYGISDYGLSVNLKISREEARNYIDSYFARYPKVRAYMDRMIEEARDRGFVSTIFKRRRYLPDLGSRNFTVRSFAERTAMNTPIQGSAADIIKMAMVKVQNRLEKEKREARMLLQVHDELIFEVPDYEIESVALLVREEMENAYPLNVPLQVDVGVGPNWYDVKKS